MFERLPFVLVAVLVFELFLGMLWARSAWDPQEASAANTALLNLTYDVKDMPATQTGNCSTCPARQPAAVVVATSTQKKSTSRVSISAVAGVRKGIKGALGHHRRVVRRAAR